METSTVYYSKKLSKKRAGVHGFVHLPITFIDSYDKIEYALCGVKFFTRQGYRNFPFSLDNADAIMLSYNHGIMIPKLW